MCHVAAAGVVVERPLPETTAAAGPGRHVGQPLEEGLLSTNEFPRAGSVVPATLLTGHEPRRRVPPQPAPEVPPGGVLRLPPGPHGTRGQRRREHCRVRQNRPHSKPQYLPGCVLPSNVSAIGNYIYIYSSLGIFLLGRYQTAHPERARLRKHLYTPFSTSNLQKTTVHILNSGVRRLMGRLEQHATDGRDVDMKKVRRCS